MHRRHRQAPALARGGLPFRSDTRFVTPKQQAVAEAVKIRARREELGQADRGWNTPEAMREWVRLRIEGLKKEQR